MKLSRNEGFPGETFILFSTQVCERLASHEIARICYPTSLGFFPEACGHEVERLDGAPDHSIHLCLKGKGVVEEEGGKRAVLKAPSFVWLEADRPHYYCANPDEPWTLAWVHLEGSHSLAYLRALGDSGVAHTIQRNPGIQGHFDDLLDIATQDPAARPLLPFLLHCALTQWLSELAEAMNDAKSVNVVERRLARLRHYLQNNLAHAVSVSQMAELTGWTPNHLNNVFRQSTGETPAAFFLRLKMGYAADLLRQSNDSIAAIALEVGFEDAYYFSRCFRRCYAMSPSQYRKKQPFRG